MKENEWKWIEKRRKKTQTNKKAATNKNINKVLDKRLLARHYRAHGDYARQTETWSQLNGASYVK